ncbi:MAG: hypothetical protein DRO15_03305 [Thermoprotei archaeon]|nr:MAG: hypothetical protein DRO15_03305 [Thermoprotei archaeon]
MSIWKYISDALRGISRGIVMILAIMLFAAIIESGIEGDLSLAKISQHMYIHPALLLIIVLSSVANSLKRTFIGLVLNVLTSIYSLGIILLFLNGGILEAEYSLEYAEIKVIIDIRILILVFFIVCIVPLSLLAIYRYFESQVRGIESYEQ